MTPALPVTLAMWARQRLATALSPFVVGLGARVLAQVVAFALVVVASRHLGLEAFGVYAIAWAGAVISSALVYTGLYHAMLRAPDIDAASDTLFWLILAAGGVLGSVLLAAGLLAGGAGSTLGGALMAMAALPVLAAPASWNEAHLVRDERVRAASLHSPIGETAGLAFAIWGFGAGYGLGALIASRFVVVMVSLVITTALVRRLPKPTIRWDVAGNSARTAVPLWGTTGIGMFSAYGADLVLAFYLNPAAVGAFRGGARIAGTAADVVLQPMRILNWSRFSRLERAGERTAIRTAWCETQAVVAAILWPAFMGVGLLAEPLVAVVFDEMWLAAAPVLAVLCVSQAIAVPLAVMEPALVCTGRAALLVRLRVTAGLALLASLLVFGPWGAVSAAWGIALSTALVGGYVVTVLKRVLDLDARDLAETFAPAMALALLCGVSVFSLAPHVAALSPPKALLAHIALGAALWGAGVYLFVRTGWLRTPLP